MKKTLEQERIVTAAVETKDNLLVVARAGAAKTTTICLIAEALSGQRLLCIAFNKKIATELKLRLPASAEAKTLHSIGMNAWYGLTRKRSTVEEKKCYRLLMEGIRALTDPEEADLAGESIAEMLKTIGEAKSSGYLPAGLHPQARPLLGEEDFFALAEEIPTELQRDLINRVLARSFREALDGLIDFNDMVYLPAIMPCSFDSYPLVMVDEAQDLSALNHVLLRKIVGKRRLIAVGDPCQAIYGFRGASDNSMEELRDAFQMREFFLTLCFRSSEAVVTNARWRAPDMQWRPDAPKGSVQTLEAWSTALLSDGDAIICRNNAPLFRLAITLLRKRMNPELSSGDIVASLRKIMKKLGDAKTSQSAAFEALAEWHEKELRKSRVPARTDDQRACIAVFLEETENLGGALALLEEITTRAGRIKLMTAHKSKGLEFDRVFILDLFLCSKEGQDRNVRYVAETRARNDLFYITTLGYMEE